MVGRLSKRSFAGLEMAESVDIKDEITSGEAGLTFTSFAVRCDAPGGAERRRVSRGMEGGFREARVGAQGGDAASMMANPRGRETVAG